MDKTFEKFLRSGIDLSSIGIERREDNASYFCTPKGASIFGWAGVDGIHYCFVRGFGGMVFAVSPMNLAPDFVHPIARDFADFLRLLLASGDAAALEQAWMWDEAQFFIENELQHDGLTRLIVTKDMSERKTKMIELGDAFIAFPGGTGTLEEIAEVMSKVSLKHLDAPCILYNLNGYYDDLKALLAKMIDKGLSSKERQEGIYFAKNLDEIKQILNEE